MINNDQLFEKQLNDLYDLLENNDITGSCKLIRQICEAKNTMALEPLTILLEFPEEQVRRCSAMALGNVGTGSTVESLIKALNDSSAIVREEVVHALGFIGDERAIGPLENIRPDNPKLKKAVEYSLEQIKSRTKKDYLFHRLRKTGYDQGVSKPAQSTVANGGQAYSPEPAEPPVKEIVPDLSNAGPSAVRQPEAGRAKSSNNEGEALSSKNPLFAAIASFLVPGLGQLYNGEKFTRVLLYFIGFIVGCALLVLPGVAVWIYGIYNAYATSKKINAGTLPYKEHNTGLMVIYAVCAFIIIAIFLVVLTVVMAAVIAAFVFSYGGEYGNPVPIKEISASYYRVDTNTIMITIGGNDVASLTGIRVMVNGTEVSPISGKLTSEEGSSATYGVGLKTPVTVYADFNDGNTQMVYQGRV